MLFTGQIGEVCSLVVTIGYCLFEDSFPFSRSFLCSYSFSSLGFPLPKMEADWRLSARLFTGFLTVRGCNFNLGRLSKSSVKAATQFTISYLFYTYNTYNTVCIHWVKGVVYRLIFLNFLSIIIDTESSTRYFERLWAFGL